MDSHSITLPEAAVRIGRPWYTAHRLALSGALGPLEQVAGRWILTIAGVDAYLERRKPAAETSLQA